MPIAQRFIVGNESNKRQSPARDERKSLIKYILLVVFDAVLFQKRAKLCFEIHLPVMFGLIVNVIHGSLNIADAD